MKILYLGTVCNELEYEKISKEFTRKPSIASLIFESALLSGMKSNSADVEIISFPMIPGFPDYKKLILRKSEKCYGYPCRWITTINLPIIKAISRKYFSRLLIRKWMKQHRNEDFSVLMYSICPFLVDVVQKNCKKFHKKCYVIVPDLPQNMFMNHNYSRMKKLLTHCYLEPAIRKQSLFDGYIYLTEAMKNQVAPTKPYIVVEGIAKDPFMKNARQEKGREKFIVLYAGQLHEKYGLKNLIEAVIMLSNVELRIFGTGSYQEEIKQYAKHYPCIKFFGQVSREEVLQNENFSDLLVNCRDANDEYSKYSFPSKTIEYMLSGTPVLTTRLPGIPEEYYDYIFSIENNSKEAILDKIREIASFSDSELRAFGMRARNYVVREKNATRQTQRILDFILNANKLRQ